MRNHVRKYVLILLMVLTALLCTAGASTWILLSEKTVDAPKPFTPIATTVSGTITSTTAVYEGENATVSGYTIKDANNVDVSEYFTATCSTVGLEGSADSVDGITVTATVSFTAKTALYSAPTNTATAQVKLKAVAYTRISSKNKFYSNVEDAVAGANAKTTSSASVVVIPNLMETDGATRHPLTVNSALTLNSGVSMYLPYVDDSYNGKGTYGITEDEIATYSGISSYADSNVATNRVTILNLKNTLTVASGANLYLGGQCGALGVVGKYAELNLDENASIDVSGGFYCYGYVKEKSDNAKNGNQTAYKNKYDNSYDAGRQISISNTGYLKTSISIYDMKGAGDLKDLNDRGMFPLNLFDFPNLQTYVAIAYGGKLTSQTHVLAKSSQMNYPLMEEVALISSDASTASVFYLNSGDIGFEYCPTGEKTTTTNKTRIYLNGNVSQGEVSLTVAGETVTTANKFLPFSYKFNIFINTGTFTSDYKAKFLPGSLLQINKGGTLNANSDFIFYKAEESGKIISYPTTHGDAQLINNGELTLTSAGKIGALIETTATDTTATCDFTSCTSSSAFNVTSIEGEMGVDITRISEGYFKNATNEKQLYQFVAGSTITSLGSDGCWSGRKYALYGLNVSITETSYAVKLFSYQIYRATDANGTGAEAITNVETTEKTVNIPEGMYVKIDAKRQQSALLDGVALNTDTWYQVTGDMNLVITPSEGIKLILVTDGDSGNDATTFTVYESPTQNGTFYEIGEYDVDAKSSVAPYKDKCQEVVYVMKNGYFKTTGHNATGTTALNPSDAKISTDGENTSSYKEGNAYKADKEYYVYYPRKSCIASGTLITLADGTQKAVENLTTDDILLVFNHETGKYDTAGITFIEDDGWNYYNVINLIFSDGTHNKLIYEHALFDATLNKYVYITESNYAEFIGHEFVVQEGDWYDTVTLTNAYVAKEYTGCYSLVTVYHLNYFIDGLLSIPGGIEGLFNIFEYGENLKFDEEKMQADIEKYGLYTYEDFKDYIPEEIYYAFPAPHLKVAVGKGMLTFDTILDYIEQFIVKNGLM